MKIGAGFSLFKPPKERWGTFWWGVWGLAEWGDGDLAEWLERLTANAEVASVLGLISYTAFDSLTVRIKFTNFIEQSQKHAIFCRAFHVHKHVPMIIFTLNKKLLPVSDI